MMKVWTAVLVCGAMVSVVAWAMALLRENGVCPFAAVTRFVRGLPWFGRVAVLPLFVALIAYGSVKQSAMDMNHEIHETHEIDGRDTNQIFNAEAQSSKDTQSGEGNRVERVEEDEFDGIVENAIIAEDWLKFGGYEDWIYIGPGAWSFRYGSNFVERLAAFSSGKIRVLGNGGGDAILSLAGAPVSIAPKANWGSLGGAESCFWHVETPSNTLVLTWQNALLNRDSNSLVNIQAELFSSGEMRVTHDLSGEVETEYLPALPYPETDTVDELLARIDPDHTNAYFFAEVCVAKGPSKIDVRCEGGSLLGDYSVMAYPGETNRLPMLIGPKYEVKGEAAFEHFAVQQEEVAVTNLTDRVVEVRWPVKFTFEEQYAPG